MTEFNERLLQLHHCKGIGWKSIFRLLQVDPTLLSIYELSPNKAQTLLQISNTNAKLFINDLHSLKNQSMLKHYNDKNIHVITIFDREYPELLKQIYDPPWVLYLEGNINILNETRFLGVVGTRNPTHYGYLSMEKVLVPLIKKGWVIISGLAMGIDTKAHQLSLEHNGSTIAVIAGGLHHIYPKCNQKLASEITGSNLIISEYPPDSFPEKWQFPMRNRIISGLSSGTIIIEAQERSGSLITANLALQQGREVFAIPGPIHVKTSIGTNQLIQAGAKLVLNSEDITAEFAYL